MTKLNYTNDLSAAKQLENLDLARQHNQKAFDVVLTALRKQGVASLSSGGCVLRGAHGNKCAIGHLIPDERYTPDLDKGSIRSAAVWDAIRPDLKQANKSLLQALQRAHDEDMPRHAINPIAEWERRMAGIAFAYGLAYKAPT